MAFSFTKEFRLTEEQFERNGFVLQKLNAAGFKCDGAFGSFGGGWVRVIKPVAFYDTLLHRESTSISAPGSRWVQVDWRWKDDGEKVTPSAKISWSISGVSPRSGDPKATPKRIRVVDREGAIVFEGDNTTACLKFSKLFVWHYHEDSPFRGKWRDRQWSGEFTPVPIT